MSDPCRSAKSADTCKSPQGRLTLVSPAALQDDVSLLQMRLSTDEAQQGAAEDADAYDELEDPNVKKAEDAKVEDFKKKEDKKAEAKQVEKDTKKVAQQKETIKATEGAKDIKKTTNEVNDKEKKLIAEEKQTGGGKINQQQKDEAKEKQEIKKDHQGLKKDDMVENKLAQAKAAAKLKEEQLHNANVKAEQELKDKHRLQEHNVTGPHAAGGVVHAKTNTNNIASNVDDYERVLEAEVVKKRAQIRDRLHHAIGDRMYIAGHEAGWQHPAYETANRRRKSKKR